MMIAFAIMIGGVFLASAGRLLLDKSEEQRTAAMNDVGYLIQDEIILASTVSDGYQRTFVLPQRADRFEYSITSFSTAVTITSGKTKITYPIPEISGSIQKGPNTIVKQGTISVSS